MDSAISELDLSLVKLGKDTPMSMLHLIYTLLNESRNESSLLKVFPCNEALWFIRLGHDQPLDLSQGPFGCRSSSRVHGWVVSF
jgi:hypothetical protein